MASNLPGEILLNILQHCDAETLSCCRGVSRKWNDTADILQSSPGYWHTAATSIVVLNEQVVKCKILCSIE